MNIVSQRRHRYRWVAVIAVVAAISIAGNGVAAPGSRWLPFRWVAAEMDGQRLERAAILVPVKLRDLPGDQWFQLDLGATQNSLHGAAVREISASFPLPAGGTTVSGEVAGVVVENEPADILGGFRAMVGPGQPMPAIGTLGLSFFAHRVLVLDYPNQRFMVLREDEGLPASLDAHATFVAAVNRNGKLYVPIEIGGTVETGYFLDTGASAFVLMTSSDEWRRLTGRRGDESSNSRLSVPSWDDTIRLVGAPMHQSVSIGPATHEHATIWYASDERFSFRAWPATKGLIGNELFAGGFVVIVDMPRGRFGIARTESAQPNKRLHPSAARAGRGRG